MSLERQLQSLWKYQCLARVGMNIALQAGTCYVEPTFALAFKRLSMPLSEHVHLLDHFPAHQTAPTTRTTVCVSARHHHRPGHRHSVSPGPPTKSRIRIPPLLISFRPATEPTCPSPHTPVAPDADVCSLTPVRALWAVPRTITHLATRTNRKAEREPTPFPSILRLGCKCM